MSSTTNEGEPEPLPDGMKVYAIWQIAEAVRRAYPDVPPQALRQYWKMPFALLRFPGQQIWWGGASISTTGNKPQFYMAGSTIFTVLYDFFRYARIQQVANPDLFATILRYADKPPPVERETLRPVVINTDKDIWRHEKELTALIKQRKADKLVAESMSVLNAAIAARQSPNGRLFLALDVEAWEQDHSKITEIGWTLYDPRKPVDSQMWARHFIVTENARRINSRYVPDHRHSFNFGVTRMLLLDQIVDLLLVDLKRADCVLIGHALKGDLEFLEEVGLSPAVYVSESYDTSPMYHAKSGKHQAGLKEMCTTFGIPTKHLHNAGNDAYYTMLCFIKMTRAEGDADIQPKEIEGAEVGRVAPQVRYVSEDDELLP